MSYRVQLTLSNENYEALEYITKKMAEEMEVSPSSLRNGWVVGRAIQKMRKEYEEKE